MSEKGKYDAAVAERIVELCAVVAERTRIRGQKYHWWGAYWTYINQPASSDDAAMAIRAEAAAIIDASLSPKDTQS